jgi:uncharacterized phage protein (TIGR01671 family)
MEYLDADDERHNHYLQVGAGGFWLYRSVDGKLMAHSKAGDILLQFTGLKDKSGKEIYEGDIVDRDSNMRILAPEHINFCVYWGSFCWMRSEQLNKHGVPFDPIDARSNCIIVGNIYEHPHLLNPATPTQ